MSPLALSASHVAPLLHPGVLGAVVLVASHYGVSRVTAGVARERGSCWQAPSRAPPRTGFGACLWQAGGCLRQAGGAFGGCSGVPHGPGGGRQAGWE